MSFINYDSPDYQRMMQQAAASSRGNTAAMRRKVQQKYVGDVMQRRGKIQDVQAQDASATKNLDYGRRALGLKAQGLQDRLAGQRYMNQMSMREMKDRSSDLNRGMLMGLAPLAYSTWAGNQRKQRTQAEADRNIAWQRSQMEAFPELAKGMRKRGFN